jgi:hypothetical protein
VAFRLIDTLPTDDPVTRGTCAVSPDGHLVGIAERRLVSRHPDGTVTSEDGAEPRQLDPETPVSVNLWGFLPTIWPVLQHAVQAAHPDVAADGAIGQTGPRDSGDAEVLLPEVVGEALANLAVSVLTGPRDYVGVTHAQDLPVARSRVERLVGQGARPESPWAGIA